MASDDFLTHPHTIWGAINSLLILVVGTFAKIIYGRFVSQVDAKADKEVVDGLARRVEGKADMTVLDLLRAEFDRRHEENLTAFRDIRAAIERNNTEAAASRATLQGTMQQLVGQVARVEGYMAAQTQGGKP